MYDRILTPKAYKMREIVQAGCSEKVAVKLQILEKKV